MTSNNSTEIVAILGRIVTIPPTKSYYMVYTVEAKKTYKIINPYTGFFPAQESDSIYGICKFDANENLELIRNPFVKVSNDSDTVIALMFKILRYEKVTFRNCTSLYNLISSVTESPSELINSWCIDIVENNDCSTSSSLDTVLTQKQKMKFVNEWYKRRILRSLYLLGLMKYQINECVKIANSISSETFNTHTIHNKIISDPMIFYNLSMEIKTKINDSQGKRITKKDEYCSAIMENLYKKLNERNISSVQSSHIQKDFKEIVKHADILKLRFGLKVDMDEVYLPHVHCIESVLSKTIKELIRKPIIQHNTTFSRNDLSEDQKVAIRNAMNENFSIICGSAGSGKTTVIKEIIYNLKLQNKPFILTSFTGKAVGRIKQVTGIGKEAHTIHRFLNSSLAKGFLKPNMTVIIDEASMVTFELFYEFLTMLNNYGTHRFIIIGDINQLPPITWGYFMENCMASKYVKKFRLTNNHRVDQDDDSIIHNCKLILNPPVFDPDVDDPEEFEEFKFKTGKNFTVIEGGLNTIKVIVTKFKDSNIQDSKFTIISPYNKDIVELNKICQVIYNNENEPVIDSAGIEWRVGDKVMMTTNNYDIGIMNGDEGRVSKIDETSIYVKFTTNDGDFEYSFLLSHSIDTVDDEDLSRKYITTKLLILGYAYTVHKAQGSENDIIIVYIPKHDSQNFVNNNLIYTAVTRGKKAIFMVGDINTINSSVYKKRKSHIENLTRRIDSDVGDGVLFKIKHLDELLYSQLFKIDKEYINNLNVDLYKKFQLRTFTINDSIIEMDIVDEFKGNVIYKSKDFIFNDFHIWIATKETEKNMIMTTIRIDSETDKWSQIDKLKLLVS